MGETTFDMLGVGEIAPDFTLADDQGHSTTLSQYRGRKAVVLVFYPADQTPGCTAQLCEMRDSYAELAEAGVEVFGVNPGSEASHRRFSERQSLPFRLLVDRERQVAKLYRTQLGWGPLGLTMRSVYGIDRDGRIVFARSGKPTPREVLEALTG